MMMVGVLVASLLVGFNVMDTGSKSRADDISERRWRFLLVRYQLRSASTLMLYMYLEAMVL
jgi:hypothetical protein